MPKYLLEVNYTLGGLRGVLAQGGTARRAAAQAAAESVGGSLDEFVFAFGETDAYLIGDFPDNVAAAAVALAVSTGGGATTKTTVLLTPADVDAVAEKQVGYTAQTA